MKRHIWLIISWLRLRQVLFFSCCLLCKHLRHWATRRSYFKRRIWWISFAMRLCQVRFRFLVFTVQCKLPIHCAAIVVTWKDMPERTIFEWDCQVFGHLSFLYCANFWDIGQEKKVEWQDITDLSNFEWDVSGTCSISFCLVVKLLRHWATGTSNK